MKWNTQDDIEKVDSFNEYMLKKKIFIRDESWQILMNPDKVMIGTYEYTLDSAMRDYKKEVLWK